MKQQAKQWVVDVITSGNKFRKDISQRQPLTEQILRISKTTLEETTMSTDVSKDAFVSARQKMAQSKTKVQAPSEKEIQNIMTQLKRRIHHTTLTSDLLGGIQGWDEQRHNRDMYQDNSKTTTRMIMDPLMEEKDAVRRAFGFIFDGTWKIQKKEQEK